jgi:hypothetical protein
MVVNPVFYGMTLHWIVPQVNATGLSLALACAEAGMCAVRCANVVRDPSMNHTQIV